VGYFVCGKSPESGVFAYLVSYTVPVCIMAVMLMRRMSLGSLRNAPARPMLSYGIAACLGNTGFLLIMNYQLFQVQKILGEDEVGILKVYRGAGVENAVFLTAMFSTVFFPKASVTEDKAALWTTAVKAWAKFWPVAFAVYLILELAIVLLTGKKEYTLDPYLLVLMAVAATIISIQGSLGQIIAAHSVAGVRWGVLTSTSAGLINVLVTAFLVPRIGLPGAPIAMITSYSCLHLANIWLRHHLMGKSSPPNTASLLPP